MENKTNLLCSGIKYLSIISLIFTTEASMPTDTSKAIIKTRNFLLSNGLSFSMNNLMLG